MRYVSGFILLAFISSCALGQTPNGTLDFGNTADGTAASTANTGFGGVRVGVGGGSFTIKNPGQEIGYQGELLGIASTTTSVNSVGITSAEFGDSSSTFTIAFEVYFAGGSSGAWYFFAGNGSSFGSAQSALFAGAQVFTGIQWAFGASDAIAASNRSGSGWSATGITGTPFAQNVSYTVTVVGNNSSSPVSYGAGQSVAAYTYDLWVNGALVGNDLSKALMTDGIKINAFRFYGTNSTGNVAAISLDNIRWWNSCVAPSMAVYSAIASIPSGTFTDLDLNNGNASLAGPVTINRKLKMISGYITTNASTLKLGSTSEGTLSYTGGTIIGNFARYISTTTAMIFPVGTAAYYHPLALTYTWTPTTPGTVTVSNTVPDLSGSDLSPALSDAGYSVTRRSNQYWTITQSAITGESYGLSVDGNGQLGITNSSPLRLIHSSDGSTFDLPGAHSTGVGTIANRLVVGGGVSGRFYLGGNLADNPLPVTMKGIAVKVESGRVCLNITTAGETDVVGFNISRALMKDGSFQLITSYKSNSALKANGNATSGKSYSFVDTKIEGGETYYYKVESVSNSGVSKQVGEIIEVQVAIAGEYAVYQNYPNPFNPTTNIRFDLKADAKVTLDVYNLLGMKVKSMSGGTMSAGTHEISINMSNMASGVYCYKFIAIDNTGKVFLRTLHMTLMK